MLRSDQSWGLCEALEFPSQAELNCYLEQVAGPGGLGVGLTVGVVCGRACRQSHSRDGRTNTFHGRFHSFFPATILLPIFSVEVWKILQQSGKSQSNSFRG